MLERQGGLNDIRERQQQAAPTQKSKNCLEGGVQVFYLENCAVHTPVTEKSGPGWPHFSNMTAATLSCRTA